MKWCLLVFADKTGAVRIKRATRAILQVCICELDFVRAIPTVHGALQGSVFIASYMFFS